MTTHELPPILTISSAVCGPQFRAVACAGLQFWLYDHHDWPRLDAVGHNVHGYKLRVFIIAVA